MAKSNIDYLLQVADEVGLTHNDISNYKAMVPCHNEMLKIERLAVSHLTYGNCGGEDNVTIELIDKAYRARIKSLGRVAPTPSGYESHELYLEVLVRASWTISGLANPEYTY